MRRTTAVAIIVSLCPAGPASAGSLASNFTETPVEQAIAQSLQRSVVRSFPLPAGSNGFTYVYDMASGALLRRPAILGQLYLEQPEPIGKGLLYANLAYEYVPTDTLDGMPLDALSDTRPIVDPNGGTFTVPSYSIDLRTHIVFATAGLGVRDDLDVNVTVPLMVSSLGLDLLFKAQNGAPNAFHSRDTHAGIGDVVLRSKYRFLEHAWGSAAGLLVIRTPSGDEAEFQGTGDLFLSPLVSVATKPWPLHQKALLRGYFNAGVDIDTQSLDASEPRWGVGLDLTIWSRATLAIAVLGRHALSPIAPAGTFVFVRQDPTDPNRTYEAPLFGFANERPDYYEFSLGGRVNVWKDSVLAFANVLLPLNRDGFRSDAVPLVGLEATF